MPGTAPGFVPVSAPGSAARVRAWLLCLPFQLFQVSSWQRFPFLFDYSVTIIDLSQSSRKTPAAARKAVLTLPPPSKAHTGPQRASHRPSSLPSPGSEANRIYARKTVDKLVGAKYNKYTRCRRKPLRQHREPTVLSTEYSKSAINGGISSCHCKTYIKLLKTPKALRQT